MEKHYKADYQKLLNRGLTGRNNIEYLADDDLIAAANAALALQMPLLLTGEAGCGKTDFAFAAASQLTDGRLEEAYVRSDTVAQDLLYSYDSIRRFGEAQIDPDSAPADIREYLQLNALGKGLCSTDPPVVLIDEIDKAPRDLPNDLLRELEQGSFEISELNQSALSGDMPINIDDPLTYKKVMNRPDNVRNPFIVITSNVERQLPDPFLRRCIFFHIRFPDESQLLKILEARFPDQQPLFLQTTLTIFQHMRGVSNIIKKPATSELINWAEVLCYEDSGKELQAIERSIQDKSRVRWSDLPGLCCLIKLREDREALGIVD